jgi:SAM-dependent methyltransferase
VPDFTTVTEQPGDAASAEQLARVASRYGWALDYCAGKDVIEVACGSGMGLGLLAQRSRSLLAGDISEAMVERVRAQYGTRLRVEPFEAGRIPVPDRSVDVILMFEAIYYLPDAQRFVDEAARVLRPGGQLLLTTANKDLFDFNPSPFSLRYFGVPELRGLLTGFHCEFFGDSPLSRIGLRQKLLRPVKRLAARAGLIPRTMAGKRWLKRLVFGKLQPLPGELSEHHLVARVLPTPLDSARACTDHKIIFCAARLDARPT